MENPVPPQNLINYVNGFRHRLYAAGEMAREKLAPSQVRMKRLYDRRTVQRQFSPGDQVLALLPVFSSPFEAKFTGPLTVLRQTSSQNYLLSTPLRRKPTQLCHINLLKPYYARESEDSVCSSRELRGSVSPILVAVPVVSAHFPLQEDDGVISPDDSLLKGRLRNSETLRDLESMFGRLSEESGAELSALVNG